MVDDANGERLGSDGGVVSIVKVTGVTRDSLMILSVTVSQRVFTPSPSGSKGVMENVPERVTVQVARSTPVDE